MTTPGVQYCYVVAATSFHMHGSLPPPVPAIQHPLVGVRQTATLPQEARREYILYDVYTNEDRAKTAATGFANLTRQTWGLQCGFQQLTPGGACRLWIGILRPDRMEKVEMAVLRRELIV